MAREIFDFKSVNGDELVGTKWICDHPIGNVVIITGMEEHAARYDDFATFLNNNGYNCFAVDHYGQGENGKDGKLGLAPHSAFSKQVRNTDDIVKMCKKSKLPTIIFGHSMGSFVLQDYIQRFSKKVDKVIICGSNGPNNAIGFKFAYGLSKLIVPENKRDTKANFFNKLIFGGYNKKFKHPRTEFDWLSVNEENVDKYIADPFCGYGSSNGFIREFMKGGSRLYKSKFLKKISPDINILIVSGKDDPVGAFGKGPKKLYQMYKKIGVKNVDLKLYEGMRHEILNETDKMTVYNDILSFIKK